MLSNVEAVNYLELAMQTSGFRGREATMNHQAFLRELIFDIKGGKHHLVEVVAREKTLVPPACTFPNA